MAKASDHNDNYSWITNVGCNVHSCSFNTEDHYCSAQRIDVENDRAQRKAETFCATFSAKGGSFQA